MAAGISKTKWTGNGNENHHPAPISQSKLEVRLSYEGKQDEASILTSPPAKLEEVWQGENRQNGLFYGENLSVLAVVVKTSSDS